jgi:L-amino acid N-acyltransferase YncA
MQIIDKSLLNIRQATLDDIHFIAELKIDNPHIGEHSHPMDRMMNELFLREYKRRWEKKLNEGMCTLIMSANGSMVGFINFSACDAAVPDKIAEIDSIYIMPEMRRHGLGKLLCEAALAKIRNEQIRQAVVWIMDGSDATRQFFQAMGFLATSAIRVDKIRENLTLREIRYQILLEST